MKKQRIIEANPNGLIKPSDLLTLSQEDAEQMIRSAYSGTRVWKDRTRKGDMRIGAALVSMRVSYGLPRSTIASLTGVSMTSITRLELGVRSFSAHSLSRLLVGLRNGIHMLFPGRKAEFDRWIIDFLYLVSEVEEEDRLQKVDEKLARFGNRQQDMAKELGLDDRERT